MIARLYGLRLVDNEWLSTYQAKSSEVQRGACTCFEAAIHRDHLVFYISESFQRDHGDLVPVLVRAARDASKTSYGAPRLQVLIERRPEKVDYPRLTYTLIGNGKINHEVFGPTLTYDALVHKISRPLAKGVAPAR